MNLFELATREYYMFKTIKGMISVQDVWPMPLTSKTGFDLNTLALRLKAQCEVTNFVTVVDEGDKVLRNKFEIVKYIIETKLKEIKVREDRAGRALYKKKLMLMISDKEDEDLKKKSVEDLRKELDAL